MILAKTASFCSQQTPLDAYPGAPLAQRAHWKTAFPVSPSLSVPDEHSWSSSVHHFRLNDDGVFGKLNVSCVPRSRYFQLSPCMVNGSSFLLHVKMYVLQ
jgi:hypothetical protein